jgi:hypothetical protein
VAVVLLSKPKRTATFPRNRTGNKTKVFIPGKKTGIILAEQIKNFYFLKQR